MCFCIIIAQPESPARLKFADEFSPATGAFHYVFVSVQFVALVMLSVKPQAPLRRQRFQELPRN